ncbi:MAG: EAL domain-containing protein [Pseudomonadota bacterium]
MSAFELLFNASPHPYLILRPDRAFTIVAVNDLYLAATGTRREDIVGRSLFEVFPDNPDDHSGSGVSDLRASLERVLRDRAQDIMGVQKYDIPRRAGEGFEVKYWSPVNTPVIGEDGAIAYIIHHVEDVTEFVLTRERVFRESAERVEKVEAWAERMEAEVLRRANEVKEANRKLKAAMEALEAREAELARLNGRLQDLDRVKTEFFSNVSHEFRTPLTLLLGPLDDLLGQPADALAAPQRAALEVAHRNALRLLKLVNNLLDFSRLEAGCVQPQRQPIDLGAFTAELASSFRSLCEQAGLELVVDCPPLPQGVEVDPAMWEKIVLNLLSNAFKFTFEGRIEVRLRAAAGEAELTVSDTGTGIAPQELPHLFERFHRVEGARGRSYEGSGIGLALVDELVRLHGGSVRVDSEPGKGSSFMVRLPFAAGRATAAAPAAAPSLAPVFLEEARRWLPEPAETATPAPSRGRVVVADDNADMRAYLRRLLEEAGYAVEAVADGAAALAVCQDRGPDLLLADVMMPGLDGFSLLQRLRENPATSALPVILLSARAGKEARVEGLAAGADDYLVKPFHARELVARVDGAMRLEALRREAMDTLRRSAEEMRQAAHHDALTGLPNRLLFAARLDHVLQHQKRHGQKVALLLLDLDRFKLINDTLGHAAGDRLLQVVGQRLKECLREQDTVARLGGDEFAVILDELGHTDDAELLARKILRLISRPLLLEGREVTTSASIGISICPDDATAAEDLIKAADAAMYRAKDRGRHTYDFYTADLTRKVVEQFALEVDLRQALARGEFELRYQPQVALSSGRLVGVEALLRWRHPERGLLLPHQFIAAAEESGLIEPIGAWVIEQALAQAAAWAAAGLPSLRVAVNVSGRQMLDGRFGDVLDAALRRHAVAPDRVQLEIEITESVLLSVERSAGVLQRLKARGVIIAIDDFGTGYSSLSHLKHLPIDTLKICQTFIHGIPGDADSRAIAAAVVSMGHSLGLRVIAEGVETREQLDFLRRQGCDEVQGHLVSEPVAAQTVENLLGLAGPIFLM